MEGAYLPGNIRQRMQELMKEHKITQTRDLVWQHRERHQPVCQRQNR